MSDDVELKVVLLDVYITEIAELRAKVAELEEQLKYRDGDLQFEYNGRMESEAKVAELEAKQQSAEPYGWFNKKYGSIHPHVAEVYTSEAYINGELIPLYTTPPTAAAIESMAYRRAAEVISFKYAQTCMSFKDVGYIQSEILALTPQPDALRELCLKVAKEVDYCSGQDLQAIVDRVLKGE